MGGGTTGADADADALAGLSPRGRGNPRGMPRHLYRPGLSPRGRGNRGNGGDDKANGGSIPAWAGEPSLSSLFQRGATVYPRVGGGTPAPNATDPIVAGLSPAWAGEPAPSPHASGSGAVYPRVGGGTSVPYRPAQPPPGLSPRGRGNQGRRFVDGTGGRSIPAWAGEPRCGTGDADRHEVYPRVGGGTRCLAMGLPL